MDHLVNRIGVLFLGTALLAVALAAVFVAPFGGGLDSVTAYIHTIREHEHLNEFQIMLNRRMEVRQHVLARLIEGELSLREAAHALSDEYAHQPERLRLPAFHHWLHLTQEERFMRLLLHQVANSLESDPRRDQVLKRLRTELQAYQDARPRSNSADTPRRPGAAQPIRPHWPRPIRHPTRAAT
jgi:hypothetical protein